LYGAFGLNISHDVFIASSIFLFTGFHIRSLRKKINSNSRGVYIVIFAGILAITTQYGIFLVIVNLLLLILGRLLKTALALSAACTVIFIGANIGVTQVPTYGLLLPVLADIKCVVQHRDAEVSEVEWKTLIVLAPKSEWVDPTTCSMIDAEFQVMPSLNLSRVKLTTSLIKTYLGITGRNSAIVAMAHFQRASIALPPPFFAGPQNQVNMNPDIPIGLGTNTALQSHAEVLHPSIDEPSVALKISYFRILEIPAQGLIFVVNQASWFWGWGGLFVDLLPFSWSRPMSALLISEALAVVLCPPPGLSAPVSLRAWASLPFDPRIPIRTTKGSLAPASRF
jgi:hypothetical protein